MPYGLPPRVSQMIDIALDEDLGNGDITTSLTVPKDKVSTGRVIAKQKLIMSGGDVFAFVMNKVDPNIEVEQKILNGESAEPGDLLITAVGCTRSLLTAERVALNFLQRLCGVAVLTKSYVEKLPASSKTSITDTRKTSPGLRFLERRAVIHGGGKNHRADLGGGVLIKENHIAAAGSIKAAVSACLKGAPHPLRVEIEVRNLTELEEALNAGATAILLDNMSPQEMKAAVERVGKSGVVLEASGNMTPDKVAETAACGVDIISVGALTHSYPSADISFLIDDL